MKAMFSLVKVVSFVPEFPNSSSRMTYSGQK
jgi:hypothetical protein